MADLYSTLTPDERMQFEQAIRLLIGRPLYRDWRMKLIVDLLTRLENNEWILPGMQKQGAQQIVLNIANGRLSSIEIKVKV